MSRTIVVGSRGSLLALAQTQAAIQQLKQAHPGHEFVLRKISTRGDELSHIPLPHLGGRGIFTKELETALLQGEIDLAVHSFKDMPIQLSPGLRIAAIGAREDARDALISREGQPLSRLSPGARLGTSSPRRAAQIRARRPDLNIVDLRGNIDTRLRKVKEGQVEAAVLAAAGLIRLGWADRITEYLPPEVCLPAVGQGALAMEIRGDDGELKDMLSILDHEPTRQATTAERAFLEHLGGGCQTPIGAFAQVLGPALRLQGMIASPQGGKLLRDEVEGEAGEPEKVGRELAQKLLGRGAGEILSEVAP
ncbi:MAG: hydroxymethylbilane synthase [Dehalococcoidia bacterium]